MGVAVTVGDPGVTVGPPVAEPAGGACWAVFEGKMKLGWRMKTHPTATSTTAGRSTRDSLMVSRRCARGGGRLRLRGSGFPADALLKLELEIDAERELRAIPVPAVGLFCALLASCLCTLIQWQTSPPPSLLAWNPPAARHPRYPPAQLPWYPLAFLLWQPRVDCVGEGRFPELRSDQRVGDGTDGGLDLGEETGEEGTACEVHVSDGTASEVSVTEDTARDVRVTEGTACLCDDSREKTRDCDAGQRGFPAPGGPFEASCRSAARTPTRALVAVPGAGEGEGLRLAE